MTTSTPSFFAQFAPHVARILLGLIFFVFGLNEFLNFFPPPPPESMPKTLQDFFELFMKSSYLIPLVKNTEVVANTLLLANHFVPLALVILAPMIVNIVLVHLLLAPSDLNITLLVLALKLSLA